MVDHPSSGVNALTGRGQFGYYARRCNRTQRDTVRCVPHRMHPLVHPQRDQPPAASPALRRPAVRSSVRPSARPPRNSIRSRTHPGRFLRERRALFSIGDNSTPFLTSDHHLVAAATPAARHFILVYPGRHSAPAERLTHWR